MASGAAGAAGLYANGVKAGCSTGLGTADMGGPGKEVDVDCEFLVRPC